MSNLRNFLLITIALLCSFSSFACDCVPAYVNNWTPEIVKQSLEKADVVFIGEVTSYGEEHFSMKPLEVFKGQIKGDTVYGRVANTCSIIPEDGLWIVYGKVNDNSEIEIGLCSLSRSLTNLGTDIPPPVPELNITDGEIENYRKEQHLKMLPVHLKYWMNEYVLLAEYKNNTFKNLEEKKKNYLTYVAIGLSILAILLVFFKK